MNKRLFLKLSASAALALAIGSTQAAETLKIGAVAPKTGGLAGGAVVSFWPNGSLNMMIRPILVRPSKQFNA